jgi:hypothetical protein
MMLSLTAPLGFIQLSSWSHLIGRSSVGISSLKSVLVVRVLF